MTLEEMLAILRGKVLYESPEQIQDRLNEIADYLEQVVKERDAAIADLYYVGLCEQCKNSRAGKCWEVHRCEWEWRGVKEEQ